MRCEFCRHAKPHVALLELARFEQSNQRLDERAVFDDPALCNLRSWGGPCEVGNARGVLAPRAVSRIRRDNWAMWSAKIWRTVFSSRATSWATAVNVWA